MEDSSEISSIRSSHHETIPTLEMEPWRILPSSETIPQLPIRKSPFLTNRVLSISVSTDSMVGEISSAVRKTPSWGFFYTIFVGTFRAFHGGRTSLRISFTAWKDWLFKFQIVLSNASWFSRNSERSLETRSSLDSMISNRWCRVTISDFRVQTSDFRVQTSDFRIQTSDWISASVDNTTVWNSWSVIL